jgi:hypothetical protein
MHAYSRAADNRSVERKLVEVRGVNILAKLLLPLVLQSARQAPIIR